MKESILGRVQIVSWLNNVRATSRTYAISVMQTVGVRYMYRLMCYSLTLMRYMYRLVRCSVCHGMLEFEQNGVFFIP